MQMQMLDQASTQKLIDDGLLIKNVHPVSKISIYNYTALTQFSGAWNDFLLASRGLILEDQTNKIIARPFKKFFNWGEKFAESIEFPVTVSEKLDGSLGILYSFKDKFSICTRGSFTSEQGIWATDFLYRNYEDLLKTLNKDYTYLFEIIYPDNRIVVDYGKDFEGLFLIAVIDKNTGKEPIFGKELKRIGFPVINSFSDVVINDENELQSFVAEALSNDTIGTKAEGVVLRSSSGGRIKIKYSSYVAIHRFKSKLSLLSILKAKIDGSFASEFLEVVPDEVYNEVKELELKIESARSKLLDLATNIYLDAAGLAASRKDFAESVVPQAKKYDVPQGVFFAMLDKKPSSVIDSILYKKILADFKADGTIPNDEE